MAFGKDRMQGPWGRVAVTMRLLMTGSKGFVGGWLREVVASKSRWSNVEILAADADLLDCEALQQELGHHRPHAVIHLAAQSSVAAAIRDPVRTASVNVIGTLNLLEALEKTGFTGRLLFVGSSEEYGAVSADNLPVSEVVPLAPRNPYAASKAAAEMFVLERVRRGKLDAVCTRSFNHAGPRQDLRFVLPSLARQVARVKLGLQPAEIRVGDLEVTRDFLDVRDVASAYLTLLQRGITGSIYNVCSGQERRLADLLDTLLRLAGVNAVVKGDANLMRPVEQRRVCGDPTRLRALGWEPEIPIEQTLQSILDEWLENMKKERK